MLGRFLEFSLAAPDIQASLDFYRPLGFSQAQVGEAWPHPYAVVTDGRICLGSASRTHPRAVLDLCKAGPAQAPGRISKNSGSHFEFRRLGNDVFNELGWLDPSGHSDAAGRGPHLQPRQAPDQRYLAVRLFSRDRAAGAATRRCQGIWEQFGFVGMEEPERSLPHVVLHQRFDRISGFIIRPTCAARPCCSKPAMSAAPWPGLPKPGYRRKVKCRRRCGSFPPPCLMAPEGTPILLLSESHA